VQFAKQVVIKLEDINIVDLPDSEKLKNAWQITSSKKSFAIFAETPLEKTQWLKHLATASGLPILCNPGPFVRRRVCVCWLCVCVCVLAVCVCVCVCVCCLSACVLCVCMR
jgi:2-succinyl-5-enolpyruvyl-6-hydroxy-3-cyclohexene-1-carboxylate synthase